MTRKIYRVNAGLDPNNYSSSFAACYNQITLVYIKVDMQEHIMKNVKGHHTSDNVSIHIGTTFCIYLFG